MHPADYQQLLHQQLLRLPEVLRRTGLSRAWTYKAVAECRFPKFYKVGRASVWKAADVDRWILAQVGEATATYGDA
jgi:prophage regulatory protein